MLADLLQQLAAWQVLKQQVQVLLVLQRLDEVDKEALFAVSLRAQLLGQVLQDLLFVLDVLDVFVALDLLLLDLLHGEDVSAEVVLDEVDQSKAAFADRAKRSEIFKSVTLHGTANL